MDHVYMCRLQQVAVFPAAHKLSWPTQSLNRSGLTGDLPAGRVSDLVRLYMYMYITIASQIYQNARASANLCKILYNTF